MPSNYIRLTIEIRVNPHPFESFLLNCDYFYDFKHLKAYTSVRPGVGKDEPEVKDIRFLQYNPSTSSIYYKLLFDEPYCSISKRNRINKTNKIQNDEQCVPLYNKSLSLTLSKCTDLQKLKKFLPHDTHSFYDTFLHHNDFKAKIGNA